ncbi:MAG: polysaccharide export protein, partial [Alphaproteobacteria bacterium]
MTDAFARYPSPSAGALQRHSRENQGAGDIMTNLTRRGFVGLGAMAALSGCAALPRGAPVQDEVLASTRGKEMGFAVYPVTRAFLADYARWPSPVPPGPGWLARRRGPASAVIVAGDRLELTIWDSEENSLLTPPGQRMTRMTDVVVAPDGTIFLPYVDALHVAGMTPETARAEIQKRLSGIVPSVQVQLRLVSGRRNSVDLVGGVRNPGRYPLEDRDTTILSLLALGGGVSEGLRNPQVRLLRGGRTYRISLARLVADPSRDTTLRGGDKVVIEADTRHFLALGAATREELIYFPSDSLTAIEALSLAGGISDTRADPRG